MIPPSGTQFEITRGSQRAVVVECGGGLRHYEVGGQAVLDGYAVDRMADGGRGQPLLPWPNRLADGHYEFDGQQLQLPIDEVGRRNAIHGLTRWLNWTLADRADDRVRVAHRLHPQPGYPFTLDLQIEYSLDESGLTVRTTTHNVGQRRLPFGAGQHPYFTVGTALVDSAELQLPAESRLDLDEERRLPTGNALPVVDTSVDFRQRKRIGSLIVDECFGDLVRDADNRARVTLSDPGSGRSLVIWMDERYRYIQAFTGDTLTVDRRRRGLAIEPVTCPPDAFRTGTDLIVLEPDETCTLTWGVSPGFDKAFTSR
jgi:galactose mutarotase-like enzyme